MNKVRIELHRPWAWGFGRSPDGFEFTAWMNLGPLYIVFDPHAEDYD